MVLKKIEEEILELIDQQAVWEAWLVAQRALGALRARNRAGVYHINKKYI